VLATGIPLGLYALWKRRQGGEAAARAKARVEKELGKAEEASVPAEVVDNMYRLLGAYRGLSEALVELVQRVSPIDWARLREARF